MIRGTILKRVKNIPFFQAKEMPIANEIPIGSDIHYMAGTPSFSNIRNIDELIDAMRQMPVIVHGKAEGRIAGQWYTVTFPRRVNNPSVVATAMARAGDIIESEIPRVTKPSISPISKESREDIPPIRLKRLEESDFEKMAKDTMGQLCSRAIRGKDWWIPGILSTETMCRILKGSGLEDWLHWFWFNFSQIDTDQLKKGVEDTIDMVYKKLWAQVDRTQTAVNDNIDKLNNATNEQVNFIRDRVNEVIKDLYRMWGVPRGYILTPVHIRNITPVGFEWQSFGETTIHFIAIGEGE